MGRGHTCDHKSERGLSGTWGAIKDQRRKPVGFERPAKKLTGTEKMFLTDDILDRGRAHSHGKRRVGRHLKRIFYFGLAEEFVRGSHEILVERRRFSFNVPGFTFPDYC
jgi:hypothetical protein